MKVSLTKLKPHPLNSEIYNLSAMDDLISSIEEVGLLQNLVIDQDFQVISGNRRLEAVKRLGWKSVPCDRVEVNQEEVAQYLIHFNKQRIKSCRELINEAKILIPLYKVGQGRRTDLTSVPQNTSGRARDRIADEIGISSSQIGKLLFIDKEDPSLIDLIDQGILTVGQGYLQVRRLKNESASRSEKISSLSFTESPTFVFHHKSSSKMGEVSDEEVDLLFTSPPYWNKRQYTKDGGIGNESDPNEYVENLTVHFDDCSRVLNPSGSFFLVIGDTFQDGNLLNIPHRVVLKLQDHGWMLRNTIIWSKTNPKPQSSKSNLTPTYEFIFHLVKGLDYKYRHTLAPLKHTTRPSHAPRHRDLGESTKKTYPYIPREGKNMGDWWSEEVVRSAVVNQFTNGSSIEHPAPFPEAIVTLPILQTTDEGDLVVDPFMGTGTTGKVANKYGRRFVGYDTHRY